MSTKQDLLDAKGKLSQIANNSVGRMLSDAELEEVTHLKGVVADCVEKLRRDGDITGDVDQWLHDITSPKRVSPYSTKSYLDLSKLTKSIPETMRKDINERHVKGIDMASITGAMFTPTPIVNSIPIHDQGGEMPIGIVNYIPAGVVHTDEYDYLMETTQEDAGTAAVVKKGETKPTFKLGLKKVRNQLKVIAVVSDPVDKYTWQSSQGVVDYVGERLTREIMRTFENEIINGDGHCGPPARPEPCRGHQVAGVQLGRRDHRHQRGRADRTVRHHLRHVRASRSGLGGDRHHQGHARPLHQRSDRGRAEQAIVGCAGGCRRLS